MIRSAIKALSPFQGSMGLDAGCGIGLPALLLAEKIGTSGHVTGLDQSSETLKLAEELTNTVNFSERVSYQKGDISQLPFKDNTFDWVWSMDCAGYAPLEPIPLLLEFERVVKPGGTVAIIAWSSENLLPGYPLLEARLRATASGISPFVKGQKADRHFLSALRWFKEIGLEKLTVKTFAGNLHAPLSKVEKYSLTALFKMRWYGIEKELSDQDYSDYQRLCLVESPEFIVYRTDYYAFFTYSMFMGKVPI